MRDEYFGFGCVDGDGDMHVRDDYDDLSLPNTSNTIRLEVSQYNFNEKCVINPCW